MAVAVAEMAAVKFTPLQLLPEQLSKSHSSKVLFVSAKDELYHVQASSLSKVKTKMTIKRVENL